MTPSPGAWKTTKRKGRHLQVWIKQSITSLTTCEAIFDETAQTNENELERHNNNNPLTSHDASTTIPSCHTIDDAMNALHDGSCEKISDAREFQAFTQKPEYDWILDGHVSFAPEQERSRQLWNKLKGPNLEELFQQEQSEHDQEGPSEKTVNTNAENNDDDDDDEFGEFQTAPSLEPSLQHKEEVPVDVKSTDNPSTSSQCAVEACHMQTTVDKDEDDETLGETDVPREIFSSFPLHVEPCYHENDTEETSFYETLSDVGSLTSPEGRFTRRQHLEYTSEEKEIDLQLPEQYFSNPEWDPTLDTLRSMPWDHVPILYGHVDSTIVEEYLAQRLSQVDASHALVNSQLLKQASRQTHVLLKGNSIVHEMHHNLSMAEMYVERSQKSVAQARGSEQDCTGVAGAVVVLQEFDRRDQYGNLQRLLNKVIQLLQKEKELNKCIQSFGTNATITHAIVLERARLLNETAYEDKELARLECLNDLRLRSNQVLDVFRQEIQSSLCSYIESLCHNWSISSDTEYERLFRAMFEAQQIHVENGQLERSSKDFVSTVVKTWSECILDTLCFQADKCFARALLDPTDSSDSEYDKELIALSYELKQDSRDAVKLISLTHNLVTIRFDFEASCSYLPMVYHRLCALLTEVLHAHFVLTQHHKALAERSSDMNADALNQIKTCIRNAKVDIWRRCEQVLAKCLDQYHHFAAKKTLFPRDTADDGKVWMEDLEGLHDVLRLTQQFLSLGHEILDADQLDSAFVTSLIDFNSKSELREKLCDAFRKHLRAIHVEAMTSLGASLFNESWRFVPLKTDRTMGEPTGHGQDRMQLVKQHLLNAIKDYEIPEMETKTRYWRNELSTRTNGDTAIFMTIKSKGNPFLLQVPASQIANSHVSFDSAENRNTALQGRGTENGCESDLFSTICGLIDNDHVVMPAISTGSVNRILVKWASRLLSILLKLPLVVGDVTKIIRDLCDLYFITSFRLCAGSARNEKIILGVETVAPIISQEHLEQGIRSPRSTLKKESSGFMGFGRRPSNSSLGHQRRGSGRGSGSPTVVSPHAEAEMCAPLPSEMEDISQLRHFIIAGQINLENVVKLGKLEQRLKDPMPQSDIDEELIVELVHVLKKRQATAWSCFLVAALLNITWRHAEQTLTFSYLNEMLGVSGSQATAEDDESVSLLDMLASYSEKVTLVTPIMVKLSSRIACAHAIMGGRAIKEVLSAGRAWEASGLNEHSNDYVDELCDRYALIWNSLSSPSTSFPRRILEVAWEHICEGGFLSLLEGYSRVPYCSTEGRSLMSMDLAAFADGIDAASIIHRLEADELSSAPPRVTPKRCMSYVDIYIKVFYYPVDDIMKWIVTNYTDYQLNHMLALITCSSNDRNSKNSDVTKQVVRVQALYHMDNPRSGEGSGEGSAQGHE